MTLLECINNRFLSDLPWARVLGSQSEESIQVVVVGNLNEEPVFVFTATSQQLIVEQVERKGLKQVFALEGDWFEAGVISFVSLTDWSDLFPSVRFPVKDFKLVGLGTESCEWEWMQDQKSKVFTHRVVLSKEASQNNADKLERLGFKRMFERTLKVLWRGNKKLRSDVECEWHKYWIKEEEEK